MSWLLRLFKKSYDGGVVTLASALSLLSTLTVTGAINAGNISATGSVVLNGVSHFASDGSPEGVVTGMRKGDLCSDYTNGKIYVFGGTAGANTGWKLVTSAA
jgi:hypothetical protein